MALSVRVTGYSREDGRSLLEMEPPWWPERDIRQDPRFRCSESEGYLDYDADLSIDEARAMHEQFRPRASRGVFGCADWQAIILPMLRELDLAFGVRAPEFSRFHVRVFEWESGLE